MSETNLYRVQHLRGTTSEWQERGHIIPGAGEIVVEIDEQNHLHKLKIGDGEHSYQELAYLMARDEVVAQVLPRVINIDLPAEDWEYLQEDEMYYQEISNGTITPYSRLDLHPTLEQLQSFKLHKLTFSTENHNTQTANNQKIRICVKGLKPTENYNIQATIVETNINSDQVVVGTPIITSVNNVYIGADQPTNDNVELWLDTDELVDIDAFAPAIKNTVSGSVLAVHDVSSVEHSLDVRVKSKNLINPEAIKQLYTKTTNFDIYSKTKPLLLSSGTYTFSYLGTDIVHQLDIWNVDTSEKIITLYNKSTYMFTLTQNTNIYISLYNSVGFTEYTKEFYQLEEGSTATEYTPYVADLSGVEVSRYGKNLLSRLAIWKYSTDDYSIEPIYLKKGDMITFSFEGTYDKWRLMFFGTDENGTPFEQGDGVNVPANNDNAYIQGTYTGTSGRLQHSDNINGNKWTNICNKDCIITGMAFWNAASEVDKTLYNCQIEFSDTPTEYEPYKEPQTATASADGTVEGLTSLSPNMTLVNDTEGVVINLEYNVDTKMYIDNELAKIKAELSAAIVNNV